VIFPQGSVNYYNRTAAVMEGIPATQTFCRFYLVPGMGHTGGTTVNGETRIGSGVADATVSPPSPTMEQFYTQITNWVEKDIAPDRIDTSSLVTASSPTQTSIPICAYPKRITYSAGVPKAASSYSCL
jgi:feruloyl esterase